MKSWWFIFVLNRRKKRQSASVPHIMGDLHQYILNILKEGVPWFPKTDLKSSYQTCDKATLPDMTLGRWQFELWITLKCRFVNLPFRQLPIFQVVKKMFSFVNHLRNSGTACSRNGFSVKNIILNLCLILVWWNRMFIWHAVHIVGRWNSTWCNGKLAKWNCAWDPGTRKTQNETSTS
jgi:hypothetical protein